MAKAEIHVFYIDSLKLYVDSMQKLLSHVDRYFSEVELQKLHAKAQCESVEKVQKTPIIFSAKNSIKQFFSIVRRATKTWW